MDMQDVLSTIFGVYTPVTTETAVIGADGSVTVITQVASGAAGVDWPYILGVALFGLTLWSFFRLVGCLIKGV